MAASRKLQQEIERTIKRINEGCDEFDQIWDKVYDPDQAALKEKNEADLKKELKKLQKCRDQIKNWISGNEVKDKTDLLAARRAVERQMERFKVCERESKTKTFSKEGLSLQATKVDPAQARRNDARDWITATVSTLEEECEAFEAEVESLGGGSGGGGGGGDSKAGGRRGKAKAIPPRVTHLEASAERHRAHVARLEQLLRLLDNEAVEVADVEGVRELVDDYLARNQGGSEEAADRASATMTPDEFAEPDDLYEGLLERLDAVEAALPLVPSAVALKAHKGGGDEKGGGGNASSSSLATAGSSGSAVGGGGGSVGGGGASSAASASAAAASKAAAVAAAAKQQLAASGVLRGVIKAGGGDDDDDASSSSTSAAKTTTVVRRPSTSGAELPSSPAVSRKGGIDAPSPLAAGPASAGPSAAAAAAPPPRTAAPWAGIAAATAAAAAAASARKGGGGGAEEGGGGGPGSASGTPRASSAGGGGAKAAVGAANGTASSAAPSSAASAATATAAAAAAATTPKPPSSSSPAAATAAAPQQQQQQQQKPQPPPTSSTQSPIVPSAPPAVLQSLLAACAPRSIPTPADSAWSRVPPRRRALHGDGKAGGASADGSASSPTSPSASGDGGASSAGGSGPVVVPASYPTTRLPVLDNPALFERLDTEALFFAFYHQPGTHQQYLAARELKRQSWRYHKAHGAWFQRHEEPRAAGAEFERGTFVYFDYNVVHDDASAGWCYRLKQDFTFTYDQLEDELQP